MPRVPTDAACLALLLAAAAGSAGAQQSGIIPPGEETLKLSLGGILYRSDTRLRIDGARVDREFTLEDTLGLDPDRSSVYGEAVWRFASRHRLGLRTFRVKRDSERPINETIQIADTDIPVNTVLRADSKTTFLLADYRYSFMKTNRMELAGIAGVFGGRYEFRFNATNPSVDVERKVTAPVPVIGVSLDYFIAPRWTASAFVQGMSLDFGSVDARVLNLGASTEYMLTRNFGLGLALSSNSVKLELDKSNSHGRIGYRANTLMGYAQVRF